MTDEKLTLKKLEEIVITENKEICGFDRYYSGKEKEEILIIKLCDKKSS